MVVEDDEDKAANDEGDGDDDDSRKEWLLLHTAYCRAQARLKTHIYTHNLDQKV